MKITRSRALIGAAVALIAAPLLVAAPANAAESFDPYALVEQQGLLQPDAAGLREAAAPSATESRAAVTAVAPVEVTPKVDATAVAVDGATVYKKDNFGVVTGTGAKGTNAGFIVIKDSNAPQTYSFTIGGDGDSLVLGDDGTVLVVDASGTPVNFIAKPWAKDANGKDLATSFSVDGNTLTQTISTAGAAFPVVADPETGCGVGWCSVYFNRSETHAIASGSVAGAGALTTGCAMINVVLAGGLCGLTLGISAAIALAADANGNCLGWFFSIVGEHNPFIEPRGTSHCR